MYETGLEGKGVDSPSSLVSPTSFSCLVILVSGRLGFIEGLRLMVPIGNSDSKAFSQLEGAPSDIHPLELELLALLCLPELTSLSAEYVSLCVPYPSLPLYRKHSTRGRASE